MPKGSAVDADEAIVNSDQAEAWGGEEGRHWVAYADAYDAMSGPFNDGLLGAAEIAAGEQVLDVGCGCGATTFEAVRRARDGSRWGLIFRGRCWRSRADELGNWRSPT
jgi:hypothetical protein